MAKKIVVAIVIVLLAVGMVLQTHYRLEAEEEVWELRQMAMDEEHRVATVNYIQAEYETAFLKEDAVIYTYPFEKEICTLEAGTVLTVHGYGVADVPGTGESGEWMLVSFQNLKSPADNIGWIPAEFAAEYVE